ncbi:endothelin-converting enzyme 1 [Caerostris darwini]|uniref:Endothelin-converting enzyme 1 n=1 Tax=Caerostris darwini TaxID=1538125 RepID=A0AAV4SMD6_9ARAC|nr:endothelin-converting enzyme 1 [Caerostris darwini]
MVTKSACTDWFSQRTNLEKTLLSLSCLLVLTLVLLILVGIAFKGKSSGSSSVDGKPGCWNTNCIKTAGEMLSLIDDQFDPCTNFYEYSCGSFSQALGQSAYQNSIDSVYFSVKDFLENSSNSESEDLENLKSFYGRCMEFEGLHSKREDTAKLFLELMERFGIGGWPVLDEFESQLSLSEILSALTLVGVPVAYRVEVVPDNRIDGSYLLKISPGGPLESGRSGTDIRGDQDLKTYMLFSFLLLGASTYSKATRAVDDILGVDAYYANVEQDTESKCDTIDMLAPDESLNRLNSMIPEIDWTVLFNSIQKEAGLRHPFAVELHCKAKIRDYLVHLNDLVEVISQNYFGWCFFESFAKHVEPSLKRSQSGSNDDVPRWKECVMLIEEHAAPVLAQGLTSQLIQEETQKKVREMTGVSDGGRASGVREQVAGRAQEIQDPPTGLWRCLFVKAMKFHLPYYRNNNATTPHRALQLAKVNKDNYTAAVIELRKQTVIRSFKKLNPSADADDNSQSWDMLLTSASHIPTESSLPIYFDKIQEPYLRLHGPSSLNYGGFSASLAREWSELFISENIGISINDHTSVWDLWSKNASSCLRNLFSERLGLDTEIGNEKHLKDLFLDVGSLEIALESAKSGTKSEKSDLLPGFKRSEEQMFFIAYAQTQCEAKKSESSDSTYIPIKDRINTIVSNSKAFTDAFECSAPSSPKKCQVWT